VSIQAVVIGRGLAGLTAAYELVREGYHVSLVGPPREGASRAAQGVSSTKGLLEAKAPFFQLKLDGHRNLPRWISGVEKASGISIPKHLGGAWELFSNDSGWKKAAARIYRREFRGAFGTQLVQDPVLSPTGRAFFYPGELWFDTEICCDALEKSLLFSNVTIFDALVLSLAPGRVVLSDGRDINAPVVVLAAGAGSAALLHQAGLTNLPKLVEAGGSCLVVGGVKTRQPAVILGEKCSMFVEDSGLARLGSSTRADLGQSAQKTCIFQDAEIFFESVKSGLAGESFAQLLRNCTVISQKWGVRVRTSDRFPLVIRHLYPSGDNLFISTGYWKNGLQTAYLASKAIAWALRSLDSVAPGENLLRLFAEDLHRQVL